MKTKTIITDALFLLLLAVIIIAVVYFINNAKFDGTCEDDAFINGCITIIGIVAGNFIIGMIFYLPKRIKNGSWE